jgi:hypothetical protein
MTNVRRGFIAQDLETSIAAPSCGDVVIGTDIMVATIDASVSLVITGVTIVSMLSC